MFEWTVLTDRFAPNDLNLHEARIMKYNIENILQKH